MIGPSCARAGGDARGIIVVIASDKSYLIYFKETILLHVQFVAAIECAATEFTVISIGLNFSRECRLNSI